MYFAYFILLYGLCCSNVDLWYENLLQALYLHYERQLSLNLKAERVLNILLYITKLPSLDDILTQKSIEKSLKVMTSNGCQVPATAQTSALCELSYTYSCPSRKYPVEKPLADA